MSPPACDDRNLKGFRRKPNEYEQFLEHLEPYGKPRPAERPLQSARHMPCWARLVMLSALARLLPFNGSSQRAARGRDRCDNPSRPEDDALALVTALFRHEAGSVDSINSFEKRWDEIDDQRAAIFTLTLLLGTLIDHEAGRREQPFERVVNQMRSDIAGDRYAHELGIDPRD